MRLPPAPIHTLLATKVDTAVTEFGKLDMNGDGVISEQEEFNALDTDKDGVLSKDEYDKRSEMMQSIQRKKSAVDEAKELLKKDLKIFEQFVAEKVSSILPDLPASLHRGQPTPVCPALCVACVEQVKILATSLQMLSVFANDDSYPVSTPPACVHPNEGSAPNCG